MSCLACDRLARIAAGTDPDFVITLPETHVVLADEQVYRGYCILYLRDHHDALDALPLARQARVWEDVARVAGVLRRELAPERLNYACLGNFVSHVHWHLIPRYADDREAQHPIWVRPLAERLRRLPGDDHAALVRALRAALAR